MHSAAKHKSTDHFRNQEKKQDELSPCTNLPNQPFPGNGAGWFRTGLPAVAGATSGWRRQRFCCAKKLARKADAPVDGRGIPLPTARPGHSLSFPAIESLSKTQQRLLCGHLINPQWLGDWVSEIAKEIAMGNESSTVKASVFIGTSLDGFIARTDGVLDFETWPYGEKPIFVLSSRPLAPAPAGAIMEHLAGAPSEILAQLGARGLRHVYVDGGITIQQFLRAGLIQRLIITRVPVLIGEGIPLFGPLAHDIQLQPVATRQYASGLVQSEYVIVACHVAPYLY